MKISIINNAGEQVEERDLSFEIPEGEKAAHAVHETVVAYRAAQRTGTACTKTRGEVSATTRKPWRQKGTGRARAGSYASPIWRGGGVVFGPRPRDFSKKTNKKVKRLALRKALGERFIMGDVIVVDSIEIPEPKTKAAIAWLDKVGATGTVLVIPEGENTNLFLGARNIPHVDVLTAPQVHTYSILRQDKIVISKSALEALEQRISS